MANDYTPQQIEEILQMFFDVAGTRQYIGARYVPIFGRGRGTSVDWDDSSAYEPLSIVYYQGDTYTSRRYVPAGIPIDDQDYWVITGRYNAQVEQYRQEVLGFSERIDGAYDAVENLRESVSSDYVPFPDSNYFPKYGTNGQVLTTLANGGTKWDDPVEITSEIAEPIIEDWLDEHPEATTTVQDGAVTTPKIANNAVTDAKLAPDGIITAKDSIDQLKYALTNAVTEETYAPIRSNIGSPNVGDKPYFLGDKPDTSQICCKLWVLPNSILYVGSVASGYRLHIIQCDKDNVSLTGWQTNISSNVTLEANCEILYVAVTTANYSTAIQTSEFTNAKWVIGQGTPWTETRGQLVLANGATASVNTSTSTLQISNTGYAAIHYGMGEVILLDNSSAITVTGNFGSLQKLYYNKATSSFVFLPGGLANISLLSSQYIMLGYFFNNNIDFYCFPEYTLNGSQVLNKDYSLPNITSRNTLGKLITYLNTAVYVDTTASTFTIKLGASSNYAVVEYGNNKLSQLTLTNDIVVTGNFVSLQKLYYNVSTQAFSLLTGGIDNAATNDPNMVCLGYFFNKNIYLNVFPGYYINGSYVSKIDTPNNGILKSPKIAIVGDSISTYVGVSPNMNGGGYYPHGNVDSVDKTYSHIAAKKSSTTIALLQAVSQSTIAKQVVDEENRYGWAPDWISAVVTAAPDIVIINLGINDCFGSITGTLRETNVLSDLDAVKETDTYGAYQYMVMKYQTELPNAIIVCVIPPLTSFSTLTDNGIPKYADLCTLIEECAKFHGCPIIDMRENKINFATLGTYKFDGIHPNYAGMLQMGTYMGQRLIEICHDVYGV